MRLFVSPSKLGEQPCPLEMRTRRRRRRQVVRRGAEKLSDADVACVSWALLKLRRLTQRTPPLLAALAALPEERLAALKPAAAAALGLALARAQVGVLTQPYP